MKEQKEIKYELRPSGSDKRQKSQVQCQNQILNVKTITNNKDYLKNKFYSQFYSDLDNEGDWKTVKFEDMVLKPQIKFQQDGKTKKIRQRNDLNNSSKAKFIMKRQAVEYHKSLMEQTIQRLKIQEESGIKNQQGWISIDKNLRFFPLDNDRLKKATFTSMQQLERFIQKQEQQIIKQIGDQAVSSVFCDNYQKIVKKQYGQKEFHSLKCKINGCGAILKCIIEKQQQRCQIYLLRNKHSHTITGINLENQQKLRHQIILDDPLHDIFGFNKGVRSQTRDLKYFDPQQRRLRVAQLRRQAKLRTKHQQSKQSSIQPQKTLSFQNSEQKIDYRQDRILSTQRSLKKSKKQKEQFRQFIDMRNELFLDGLTIVDLQQKKKPLFMDLSLITRKEWVQAAHKNTTLRFIVCQELIKINKTHENSNQKWSMVIVTALNAALRPVTLAIGLSSKITAAKVYLVLENFFKISLYPHYLITQYHPQLCENLKKLVKQSSNKLKILIDTNDVLKQLRKQLKNEKLITALKEFVNPINNYQRESFKKYFTKKKQTFILEAYEKFSPFVSTDLSQKGQFYGIEVDLSVQRQLICKLRHRLRHLRGRYSLKYQLGKILQFIYSENEKNQQMLHNQEILQIQKIHCDKYLLDVRKSITPYVLNPFYLQYGQALALSAKQKQPNQYFFESQRCSCQFRDITGIPCRHIIRVLKDKQAPYLPYFDKKWIVSLNCKESQERSRTRQKYKNKEKDKHSKFNKSSRENLKLIQG